jgi:hypothetical protein
MTSVSIEVFNTGAHDATAFNITLEAHISHNDRIIIEEVETIQTSILDGETTIVFEWMPDWEGELDLVVRIDSSQVIDEFDEDNTVSLNVNVEPVPEPEGFFGSQSMMPLGMGLLGVVCVGFLFFATRRIAEGEDTEWLEDEDDEFES